jgi:uncharacterized membrane protein
VIREVRVSLLRLDELPRLRKLLRSHFLSGLLVVVPLGAAAWVVVAALRTLWGLRELTPEAWRPEHWVPVPVLARLVDAAIVVTACVALALVLSFVGWASQQILGQKLLDFIAGHLIQRIPVVRSIYAALDQLLRAMTREGGHQFSRVVYVEFPRTGVWTLAFVTGPALPPAPQGLLNVFVPTTPNPTSGFHLLVPEAEVKDSGLSVEDAFRTLLSLGIAQPAGDRGAPGKAS